MADEKKQQPPPTGAEQKQPLTRSKRLPQPVDIEKRLDGQHAPDDRFSLTCWSGFKVFNCTRCPFDSMYEEQFDIHWTQKHLNPQPVRQPMTATLFDANDKLIKEREI